MQTFAVFFFFHLVFVSSFWEPLQNQQTPQDDSIEIKEANIERLLAAHDDPVQVISLVDPAIAAILDEPRLLDLFGAEPIWMREGDKLRLRKHGVPFIDLTRHKDLFTLTPSSKDKVTEWPPLRHREKINTVIKSLQVQEMMYNLGNLTSFYNRYYLSEHGARSSRWIYNKVLQIIAYAPPNVHLSLETFTHEFPQISVIARFEPSRGRSRPNRAIKLPVVILASHLDSANYDFPLLSAPGADDGGSGTVCILEAFRALVQAGFSPEVPVEFHWYAAEEGGLLGSQDVASEYVYQRKDVAAMFQFDLTAYVHKDVATPTLTFITNNVDTPLTTWTMKLAEEYSSSPVAGAELFPGGISDHLPWHRAGFPVVLATEGDPVRTPNPYIHTAYDQTIVEEGEFSFAHALEFVKVAVGFAVELGGWDE
ncbi:Zn-dependent exopeptidase [Chiua virens]|nr:Zn-dependent exopeptidase [Chiua virens]